MSSSDTIKTKFSSSVKQFYTKKDVQNGYDSDPGTYPFLRGLYIKMYRERLLTMRQFSGFGSAEETNNGFKFLLDHGQTGLSLSLDLHTQTGRDSDDPQSDGEIGRTGVPISSIYDMFSFYSLNLKNRLGKCKIKCKNIFDTDIFNKEKLTKVIVSFVIV